jgi:hypothetical protein
MKALFILLQTDLDFSFLQHLWKEFLIFSPQLAKGLLLVIVGWLFIKFVLYVVKKALKFTNIDALPEKLKLNEVFGNASVKIKPTKLIIATVKWVLIFIFVMVVSELLGLKIVLQQMGNLIGYLPKLISALVIFIVGIYLANVVRKTVLGFFTSLNLTGGGLVGNIVFYIISIVTGVTALNQAGINTDLITNNLSIIFASILGVCIISFGIGSTDIIKRLLFGYYSRKNLQVGDKIKTENFEGIIESIDNISVNLRNKDKTIIIPIKEIVDNRIEVLQ